MWPFGKRADPQVYEKLEQNEADQAFVSELIARMQGGKVQASDAEMQRFRQIQRRVGK